MFARCLSLALCLVSVPCLAETVTLDFLNHDPLPEWLTVERGVYADWTSGISNQYQDRNGISISFDYDYPITIESVTLIGGYEFLFPQPPGGECSDYHRENVDVTGEPIVLNYGCHSYNGQSGFIAYADESQAGGEESSFAIAGLTITLTEPVPFVAGDTDFDSDADLADLNNIRNNFGGDPMLGYGDTDRDGQIGLPDLNVTRNNFGAIAPNSSSVPEPSSVALALLGIITVPHILRTRRPRS